MKNEILAIKTAIAPLYAKPDNQSERTDEVLHGMDVLVECEKDDWLYVRTAYRYRGWVQRSLTSVRLEQKLDHFITVPSADVLAAPKVQATLLVCLTRGCTVHVISEEQSGWTKIALADGRIGYIRSVFLSCFPKEIEREAICQTAKQYLGTQYRWGGKTPLGIDCSGLCFMAYWLNGVSIYRDARIAPDFPIKKISPSRAQKGDLLFFPGHVGMLVDENTMIHSAEASNGVVIESLTPEWKASITDVGSIF
ncbi:MAG: NlpC/P60 family protein [Defluviitaleaceae bacterium]|nr:NlpC/P60 family protein [Defluviitaleaceae bacterium]